MRKYLDGRNWEGMKGEERKRYVGVPLGLGLRRWYVVRYFGQKHELDEGMIECGNELFCGWAEENSAMFSRLHFRIYKDIRCVKY